MTDAEILRVLVALVLLVVCARTLARAFTLVRLPGVIGEIVGGVLLGPTVLGAVSPGASAWLLPQTGPAAAAIDLVYELGLLLLMFLAGTQMRTVAMRGATRPVVVVALAGMIVPFALGLGLAGVLDLSALMGPAESATALTLVVAVAAAVTSIPVISRIMMDLGIMGTRFARTVVSVAVLEDIVLNVVIAIALGVARGGTDSAAGAAGALGIDGPVAAVVYHSAATTLFLALAAGTAVVLHRLPEGRLRSALAGGGRLLGPVTRELVLVLAAAAVCVFLGVAPMLGAFVVGLAVGGRSVGSGSTAEGTRSIDGFACAFFVPVYFAVVGSRLDFVHAFDLRLTVGFVAVACVVKVAGVYLGARASGSEPSDAVTLSFALNARGGPGIVLAALAHGAGIVSDTFFTTLVVTAVVTSLVAGWWLRRPHVLGRIREEVPAWPTTVPS